MMIHHDDQNSDYWGQSKRHQEIINIIVDIRQVFIKLDAMIDESLSEGAACVVLKKKVIDCICGSLLNYIDRGSDIEYMQRAINCLMDYSIPEAKALEIYFQTENCLIKCMLNVIPEIDDEQRYKVISYNIVPGDGLCLTVEVPDE